MESRVIRTQMSEFKVYTVNSLLTHALDNPYSLLTHRFFGFPELVCRDFTYITHNPYPYIFLSVITHRFRFNISKLGTFLYNYFTFLPNMARMTQTTATISFSTVMKPVDILKKGLQKLCDQTHDRKVELKAKLKANWPISEVDEEWLDHSGNLVAEEQVVEKLDKALDYDALLKKLDLPEKFIVQTIRTSTKR